MISNLKMSTFRAPHYSLHANVIRTPWLTRGIHRMDRNGGKRYGGKCDVAGKDDGGTKDMAGRRYPVQIKSTAIVRYGPSNAFLISDFSSLY
jgi:hypothetical protein